MRTAAAQDDFLFYGGTCVLVGLQGVPSAILVRDIVGGVIMRPNRLATASARWFSFGRGVVVGGLLIAAGLALELVVLGIWVAHGFGALNELRRSVLGMLLMAAGAEFAVFSFLHAVMRKHLGSR